MVAYEIMRDLSGAIICSSVIFLLCVMYINKSLRNVSGILFSAFPRILCLCVFFFCIYYWHSKQFHMLFDISCLIIVGFIIIWFFREKIENIDLCQYMSYKNPLLLVCGSYFMNLIFVLSVCLFISLNVDKYCLLDNFTEDNLYEIYKTIIASFAIAYNLRINSIKYDSEECNLSPDRLIALVYIVPSFVVILLNLTTDNTIYITLFNNFLFIVVTVLTVFYRNESYMDEVKKRNKLIK